MAASVIFQGNRVKKMTILPDLGQFLDAEVLPKLKAEDIFTHEAHRFQKGEDRWRGGCPWHKSESGTAFYVTPSSLLWRCPGCGFGGGPVQYLYRIGGSNGSPRGEDFVNIVRKLAELAGVKFPERELTEQEKEHARRLDARRAVLEDVTSHCERVLWSETGGSAFQYLASRGLAEEAIRELRLGLYDSAECVRQELKRRGHGSADTNAAAVCWKEWEGYITFPWNDDSGRPLTIYGTWNGRPPPTGKPKMLALPNPKDAGEAWEATKRSPYLFDRARRAGHHDIVLVEGIIDAAVAHAHGDARVVACVAAALSHDQVKTLVRHRINSVTIALDPDQAGDAGITSCVQQLLKAGLTPYVAPKLPGGLDPDDFILQSGIDVWRKHIDGANHAYRAAAHNIIQVNRPVEGWTDQTEDAAVAAAVAYAAQQAAARDDELDRHFWPVITAETQATLETLRSRAQSVRLKCGGGVPATESPSNFGNVGRKKRIRQLPPYVPFPIEAFPPVMREYAIAAAEAIGGDVALVAVPMLAVVAGAIGNSRVILLKKGWTEPSVAWTATIAESGDYKSPSWHAAVNPFVELQVDKADEHKKVVEQYDKDLEAWKAKPKSERGDEPERPRKPASHVTGDITMETLGELHRDAPRGLTVARDELDGWFQSFVRYKGKGGGSDRAGWLEMHRAGTLIVERLSRERGSVMVRRACASVCGTIQPGTLARALDQDALQAGMGARFLMAMPPRRRRVWTEREMPDDLAERYRNLLRELLALPMRNIAKREPFVLGLSCLARSEWVKFFNEWGHVQHTAEGEQASAYAKLEGYAARLALLHHVVSRVAAGVDDRQSILQGSIQSGIALARWFASEATRVYAMLHEDENTRRTRKLIEWIATHGEPIPGRSGLRGVTIKNLQRSNSRRWPTADIAESELGDLVVAGLAEWVEDAPRPEGGRRKKWIVISEFASDVSDDCSDDFTEGGSHPSDVYADDCSGPGVGQAGKSAESANQNGTCDGDIFGGRNQSSETSDTNSDPPF
jgi:DNA primase catalytic core